MKTVISSDDYKASGIDTMFFHGGEPHALLPRFPKHSQFLLDLRLRTWNDVGLALVVFDALATQVPRYRIDIFMPYVPGARMDKPSNGTMPRTLKMTRSLFPFTRRISTFDIHNPDAPAYFKPFGRNYMPSDLSLPQRPDVDFVTPESKGVVELLWDLFGGTINELGFKVLDPHIGVIYGDSITPERAELICMRLRAKNFASTNVVFGIGSYTYQHVTRDTYGFAIKATWNQCNGKEYFMQKDPVTGSGKKSARGRVAVVSSNYDRSLRLIDGLDIAHESNFDGVNQLEPVWRDGQFLQRQSLSDIRAIARR